MRIIFTIFLIVIQIVLCMYIYRVGYNLQHYSGKWVDISLNLIEYVPIIFLFYLVTFFYLFF